MTATSSPGDLLRLCLWVWSYARRYPLHLSAALTLQAASIGINVLRPWPTVLLIDHLLRGRPLPSWAAGFAALPGADAPTGALTWLVSATVLLFVLDWAVGVGANYVGLTLGQLLTYRVGADLFAHLQRLSLAFHTRFAAGDNIRRVMSDSRAVTTIFRDALLPLLTAVGSLVLMFVVLWRISGLLTVLALLVTPVMLGVFCLYARPMLDRVYLEDQAEGRIYSVIEQVFSAIPAVKAFGRERATEADYRRTTSGTLKAALFALDVQLRFKLLMDVSVGVAAAGMLWLGARQVLGGALTVGGIVLFLSYLNSLYGPIQSIVYTGSTIQGAGGGARRIYEVLGATPEVSDRPGAVRLGRTAGAIGFEAVGFGYEPERPVLRSVSLSVAAGERVALVGPTGAGKSTLVSLIPRFFDPDQGRVLLDGTDVRDVQLASLRAQISLVLQEPFLFPLSIAQNIAYGRPDASMSEVEAAARAANAHAFISRLPQGYETVIGERGATLSGGERQRLSIARALLKDAPVLIMDEPTSALDAETEALILQALDTLLAGRTTLVIAHRLATVRKADRIVVLDQGRIVETGSHHDLANGQGLYARLSRLQFGAQPA
jgi:ATP-binding cassette subfamily B protein/subfamily B ATP-binding cassette protein MsbA